MQESEDIKYSALEERSGEKISAAAIVVAVAALVVRLQYAGSLELLPEEAYYWNYAQHLDIGYLDHPPMVAWLIWLSTKLLGNSELAVRVAALLCWGVSAVFCHRLAANLFDKQTGWRAVILLAVLPYFFFVGMLMTPDAPLVACWAMALYFLERAVLAGKRNAWWGVGVAAGLGMLSKYTIALLGPATILFMLADRRARRWLARPEPYAAAFIALLLFTPVIVWNLKNDWVSFAFQGPRRLAGSTKFSLHVLLGWILLLITPMGAYSAAKYLLAFRRESYQTAAPLPVNCDFRRRLFILAMTAAPLSVLILFSIMKRPKLNWSGPIWLAILPALAWQLRSWTFGAAAGNRRRKLFAWTVVAALLGYGAMLHYVAVGFPSIGYPIHIPLLGWRDLGAHIEQIELFLERETGEEPLVVALDKYNIASELAFYRLMAKKEKNGAEEIAQREAVLNTTGRHLFGGNSLMYAYWTPPGENEGRILILIDDDTRDITAKAIGRYFEFLSPVYIIPMHSNGKVVNTCYYRIGYNYSSIPR